MEALKVGAPLTVKEPEVLLDPKLPVGTSRVQLVAFAYENGLVR